MQHLLFFSSFDKKILNDARATSVENHVGLLSNGMAGNNIALTQPLKTPEEDHGDGLASGGSDDSFLSLYIASLPSKIEAQQSKYHNDAKSLEFFDKNATKLQSFEEMGQCKPCKNESLCPEHSSL